jgi:hypothetical protein
MPVDRSSLTDCEHVQAIVSIGLPPVRRSKSPAAANGWHKSRRPWETRDRLAMPDRQVNGKQVGLTQVATISTTYQRIVEVTIISNCAVV